MKSGWINGGITLLCLFSFATLRAQETQIPSGFVDVKTVVPSIILDLRYFTSHNFVGTAIDGYVTPKCIISKPAAEALAKVQEELLAFSLSLKIYDAYRPQTAVDHFVRWAKVHSDTLTKREFYPTLNKKYLFRDGYVAKKSSHTRGSTLDCTIVPLPLQDQPDYQPGDSLCECFSPLAERYKDNSLDMGTGYDCFHHLSHTENPEIGQTQRIHRLLLRLIMEKYGFRNYSKEWWHFTLKNEPFPETYFNFPIE